MPNPIFSLQDVDPYNQGLMHNDPNVRKKAQEFYANPNHAKDYNRAYSEARGRKMAPVMSAIGGG